MTDDELAFDLTCAHGALETESTANALGTEWHTTSTFVGDASYFSNTLTIRETARHIVPPHDEGINPVPYRHSFTAIVDGLAAGIYDDSAFETIVSVGPPLRHGQYCNLFHRDVTINVGTSVDIHSCNFSLIGRHAESRYVDIYSGKLILFGSPNPNVYGSATVTVDQEEQATINSVVSGVRPSDIVGAVLQFGQSGPLVYDFGRGDQWNDLGGIAASRAILHDRLPPGALQALATGQAWINVYLRSGSSVTGHLPFEPQPTIHGDFKLDGRYDRQDVNALSHEIALGGQNHEFDITGDGLVDRSDLDEWLSAAGFVNNPSGQPFLNGDANLDSDVDDRDFNIWSANRFSASTALCNGDFNVNGAIDGEDFGIWNGNKYFSVRTGVVPEPSTSLLVIVLLLAGRSAATSRDGRASWSAM
jgi:hypothetical protein